MDDLKKQLEILFPINTSTSNMTVEHLQIQQPIVENNKLKEEIQLQSKKQRNTTGTRSSQEIQLEEQQEMVNRYGYCKI